MTRPPPPLLPTLPMQLMLTLGCWLSSPFALRCAKTGWPPSSNPESPASDGLRQAHFQQALAEEAKSRASSLLSGILRYVETPYARTGEAPPSIWQKGNARLLDYGAAVHVTGDTQPIVLFVPSLINRYYILDLEKERSLLRFLGQQGIYPLVLDWGEPGDFERGFGCERYVTEILGPAIDFITGMSRQKLALAGYCMGGVLALAAARLKRRKLAALALLATPWDFHCKSFSPFIVDKQWHQAIRAMIASREQLPADVIQSLFYATDPWVFEQKFRRFAAMPPDSRAAKDFVALERWVNDGVPMTAAVAQDCLIGWAQHNLLAARQWEVGGEIVDPSKIKFPGFIAIPTSDHVVPMDCAMPLAKAMPKAHIIHPGAGHVGMIVGTHARRELWQPLADWLWKAGQDGR